MKVMLNLQSGNKKVGPIPVSTSQAKTCPNSCPMKENGCYAKYGPISWHWKKVEEKGLEWEDFLEEVEMLHPNKLWRHNQAGDLAGSGETIDYKKLKQLVIANGAGKGFTYTHYTGPENYSMIKTANLNGFTINLSANGEHEVDRLVGLGVGPVVTIMPADFKGTKMTKGGNAIVCCPAVEGTLPNCKECGVCQVVNRKSVIGFPAHGAGKNYLKAIQEKL